MTELYFLVLIVALFSVIQSIFGVGLLLFGTPTLLLLEYSYSETLWLLLPCSLTISLIQVVNDYKLIEAKKRAVYFVIPTLVLGLGLVLSYLNGINITNFVGVVLILIGITRFSPILQRLLVLMVKKNIQMFYIIIGFLHGITNMGGGPLSIVMSTIYLKKEIIRSNVAFVYLILASFQLLVLFIMSHTSLRNEFLILIPITMASYFFTSKFVSLKVNDKKYTFTLNIIVLVYGVLALIK
jgi:uncharacterized protein